MDSITISNGQILGKFGIAFKRLCQAPVQDAQLKLELLSMRKFLADQAELLVPACQDADEQSRQKLLDETHKVMHMRKVTNSELVKYVTVEDAFLLSPIVKEA